MSIVITRKNTETGQLQWQTDSLKREYTCYYVAKCDNVYTTPVDVLSASDIPQISAQYSADVSCYCTSVKPTKREDNPLYWDVEIVYSVPKNQSDKPDTPDNPEDPTDWMVEVSGSWVKRQVPCQKDVSGNAITNSVPEAYLPPPMVDREDLRISITRYEHVLDLPTIVSLNNSVNSSDELNGTVSAGLGKLSIGFAKERINDGIYWKMTYVVEINNDGWNLQLIDKGFLHLVDDNGDEITSPGQPDDTNQAAMTDDNGCPCKSPQFLNGCGGKLPKGLPPVVFWQDENGPQFENAADCGPSDGYEVYQSADWSVLNLRFA